MEIPSQISLLLLSLTKLATNTRAHRVISDGGGPDDKVREDEAEEEGSAR